MHHVKCAGHVVESSWFSKRVVTLRVKGRMSRRMQLRWEDCRTVERIAGIVRELRVTDKGSIWRVKTPV